MTLRDSFLEPEIPAIGRLKTWALDRTATGTDLVKDTRGHIKICIEVSVRNGKNSEHRPRAVQVSTEVNC